MASGNTPATSAHISSPSLPITPVSSAASKVSRRSSRVPKIVLPGRSARLVQSTRDSPHGAQAQTEPVSSTPLVAGLLKHPSSISHPTIPSLPARVDITPITASSPPTPAIIAPGLDPQKPWKHPAELEYICRQDWAQDTIINYLSQNAFTIAPRDHNKSHPYTQVTSLDNSVTILPKGYRIPLMFVAKFQWESLKLVLTSANPDSEWNEFKFDIIHVSRLCSHLLKDARRATGPISQGTLAELNATGKGDKVGTMERGWRCPMFDRALTRFYRRWMVCREWSLKLFWEEYGEDEYDTDMLKCDWARWVLRGYKGFLLNKEEVESGITAVQYLTGLEQVEGKWIWGTQSYVNDYRMAIVPNANSDISSSSSLSRPLQSSTPPSGITSHTPIKIKQELLERVVPNTTKSLMSNPQSASSVTYTPISPSIQSPPTIGTASLSESQFNSQRKSTEPLPRSISPTAIVANGKVPMPADTPNTSAICPAILQANEPSQVSQQGTSTNGKSTPPMSSNPQRVHNRSSRQQPTRKVAGVKRVWDAVEEDGHDKRAMVGENKNKRERGPKKLKPNAGAINAPPTAPPDVLAVSVLPTTSENIPSPMVVDTNDFTNTDGPSPVTAGVNAGTFTTSTSSTAATESPSNLTPLQAPVPKPGSTPRPPTGIPPKPHVLLSPVSRTASRSATSMFAAPQKAASAQTPPQPNELLEGTESVTPSIATSMQDGVQKPAPSEVVTPLLQHALAKINPSTTVAESATTNPSLPITGTSSGRLTDTKPAGKRPPALAVKQNLPRKESEKMPSTPRQQESPSNELAAMPKSAFNAQFLKAVDPMMKTIGKIIKDYQRVVLDRVPHPEHAWPGVAEIVEALIGLLEGHKRLNKSIDESQGLVEKRMEGLKESLDEAKIQVEQLKKAGDVAYAQVLEKVNPVEQRLNSLDDHFAGLKQAVDGIAQNLVSLQRSVDHGVGSLEENVKGIKECVESMEVVRELPVPIRTILSNVEVQTDAALGPVSVPLPAPIVIMSRETIGVQTEVIADTAPIFNAAESDALQRPDSKGVLDSDVTMVDINSRDLVSSTPVNANASNPSLTRKALDVMRNVADILELSAYDELPFSRHGKGKERDTRGDNILMESDAGSPLISILLDEFRLIKEDLKANERRSREEITTLRLLHEAELDSLRAQWMKAEEKRKEEMEGFLDQRLGELRDAKQASSVEKQKDNDTAQHRRGEQTSDVVNEELLDLRRRIIYLEARQRNEQRSPSHGRSSSIASSSNLDHKIPNRNLANGRDVIQDREAGSHPLSHLLVWDLEPPLSRADSYSGLDAPPPPSSSYHELVNSRCRRDSPQNGGPEPTQRLQAQSPSAGILRKPSMNNLSMDVEGTPLPIKQQRKLMMSLSKQHTE